MLLPLVASSRSIPRKQLIDNGILGAAPFDKSETRKVQLMKAGGTIQSISNADITDTTPFTFRNRKVWKGELLVTIRSGDQAGTVTLNTTTIGLK